MWLEGLVLIILTAATVRASNNSDNGENQDALWEEFMNLPTIVYTGDNEDLSDEWEMPPLIEEPEDNWEQLAEDIENQTAKDNREQLNVAVLHDRVDQNEAMELWQRYLHDEEEGGNYMPDLVPLDDHESEFHDPISQDGKESEGSGSEDEEETKIIGYSNRIMDSSIHHEIVGIVTDSEGNPRVILDALYRLWDLECMTGFEMVLEVYSSSLPDSEQLGELITNIIRDGRNKVKPMELSLQFCDKLLQFKSSTAIATSVINSMAGIPPLEIIILLHKYLVKYAPSSLIASWSNYMDGAVSHKEEKGFILNWLDTALMLEHRPIDDISLCKEGLVGVIGRVSKKGLCYLSLTMPEDGQGVSVSDGKLYIASLGSITIVPLNASYKINHTAPTIANQKTVCVIVVSPDNTNVSIHRFPTSASPTVANCQQDSCIFYCDAATVQSLSDVDLRGLVMMVDKESFQDTLYTLLMAVEGKRKKRRAILLAGFVN